MQAVSFTDGEGPSGYTKLSPSKFAQARAQADATNVLPFLAGSGVIAARVYPTLLLCSTAIDLTLMVVVNISVFVVGLVACICVPRLPLGVPRRGFDLLSWLAVLYEDNVVGQLPFLPGKHTGSSSRLKSSLENIEDKFGDISLKYKV